MGIFNSTKKVASHMFDVRVDKWVGWSFLVASTKDYTNIVKDMAIPQTAQITETFEEAMTRLGLTSEDIANRKKEFTRLFIFFILLAVAIIGYGLYMAVSGFMITALISFCISIYSLTQAFRFNFWLFQIKHRKLGCTLKEWLDGKISDQLITTPPNEPPTTL